MQAQEKDEDSDSSDSDSSVSSSAESPVHANHPLLVEARKLASQRMQEESRTAGNVLQPQENDCSDLLRPPVPKAASELQPRLRKRRRCGSVDSSSSSGVHALQKLKAEKRRHLQTRQELTRTQKELKATQEELAYLKDLFGVP